jgi:hypothetical protein
LTRGTIDQNEETTMYHLTSGILGGTLALFGMGLFVPQLSGGSLAALRSPNDVAAARLQTSDTVNRGLKGDRLIVCTMSEVSTPGEGCRVRLGQAGTAATNVTVIGKSPTPLSMGRDAAGTNIPQPGAVSPSRQKKIDLPEGCESAVSIAADPVLAHTASRCVS